MSDADIHFWLGTAISVALAAITGLLAWMFNISRHMLTRSEHHRICTERNDMLGGKIDALGIKIDKSERAALAHRERVNVSLNRVASDVRVLRAQRGDDVFTDQHPSTPEGGSTS
jgi:hypothetical protein